MKTNALPEVESLRCEVRQLREAVAELEGRLEEFEGEGEDPWGIWPYCWVVAGWNHAEQGLQEARKSVGNWNLKRHNLRLQRLAQSQELRELHLT
jgi:hypothetical protein